MGKGGVGKTTTAGALALALAEDGSRTHLLSTDPAHSLGDLFGVDLTAGTPTPSPCHEALVLEELDADALAQGWVRRARAPLIELFDRGTYLDVEDVEGFLDLTLPGVDEVAAVLRLAELAADGPERVVVDTAPTGHTLRLLDAGAVVRSWTEAFDAMAEKAVAVVGQLTRRPVRLEADDLVEELEERIRRFGDDVLSDAAGVLVDRAGTVVEAETRRLADALEERGLPVAVRVRVGDAADDADDADGDDGDVVTVPFRSDLEGCDVLHRWGEEQPGRPAPGPDGAGDEEGAARLLLDLPADLLLFVGKGGVGKSTCAAAAALALSAERRVTLLGTDPAGSLEDVLEVVLDGGKAEPAPGLRVRQVRAGESFELLRARYRDAVQEAFEALGLDRSAALDRRVVQSLLELAPPGLDEVFAVVALVEDAGEGRTVVLDAAPTGHFLRLIAMPELARDWTHQLLRLLVKYRAVLGLDDFAQRLLDFAKHLKDLNLRLSDPQRSAAFVVTQPGPLVAAETRRLLSRLDEASVPVAALVVNRVPRAAASRSPRQAPEGPLPPGAARIVAPQMEAPPVGAAALGRFLAAWRVAP